MSTESTATVPFAAAAISGHLDTRTAATEVAHDLHDLIGSSCDLVLLFASFHHRAALAEAAETVRNTLGPKKMLGVTAEAVLGVDRELEGLAGMSAESTATSALCFATRAAWRWGRMITPVTSSIVCVSAAR